MEFKTGGLNNVDTRFKFVILQCSWVKKLYDDCFLEWKVISLRLLIKYFGPSFKLHSNLHFESKLLRLFILLQIHTNEFWKNILLHLL